MNSHELGVFGENFATNYLLKKGYYLLDRNYRFGRNEVDIIMEKNSKIIFLEVKTRVTTVIGEPWRAVTRSKQQQIIKVANQFLQVNRIEKEAQFDVVSIVHNSSGTFLEHIENAFIPH